MLHCMGNIRGLNDVLKNNSSLYQIGKQENVLTVWVNSVPWISSWDIDTWAGFSHERREISISISMLKTSSLKVNFFCRIVKMIFGGFLFLQIWRNFLTYAQFTKLKNSILPILSSPNDLNTIIISKG